MRRRHDSPCSISESSDKRWYGGKVTQSGSQSVSKNIEYRIAGSSPITVTCCLPAIDVRGSFFTVNVRQNRFFHFCFVFPMGCCGVEWGVERVKGVVVCVVTRSMSVHYSTTCTLVPLAFGITPAALVSVLSTACRRHSDFARPKHTARIAPHAAQSTHIFSNSTNIFSQY